MKKYTDEQLVAEAQKHQTIGAWRQANMPTYQRALGRHLLDRCCTHMPNGRTRTFIYTAYAYELINSRVVIGITSRFDELPLIEEVSAKVIETLSPSTDKKVCKEKWLRHYHAEGWAVLGRKRGLAGLDTTKVQVKRNVWSDQDIFDHAKKFSTRLDWKTASNELRTKGLPSPYKVAVKRGLYHEATAHMTQNSRPDFYDADKVAQESGTFHDRNHSPSPYSGSYVVYAYEFSDNHAYVGLTFRVEKRAAMHRAMGPVAAYTKCTQIEPVFKILQSGIKSPSEAGEKELEWVNTYKNAGWVLLNKAKAGGTGSAASLTSASLAEVASKFLTMQEWKCKDHNSFSSARYRRLLPVLTASMPDAAPFRIDATDDELIAEATRYLNPREWASNNPLHFKVARWRGLIPSCVYRKMAELCKPKSTNESSILQSPA